MTTEHFKGGTVDISDSELVIRVPLKDAEKAPLSKSGKSRIVASTAGAMAVGVEGLEDMKVNLNVYTPV